MQGLLRTANDLQDYFLTLLHNLFFYSRSSQPVDGSYACFQKTAFIQKVSLWVCLHMYVSILKAIYN